MSPVFANGASTGAMQFLFNAIGSIGKSIRCVREVCPASIGGGGGGAGASLKVSGTTTKDTARKQVMKEEGIPASQQPISQSKNASGREYRYEVSKPGGGTQIKSVQQQTLDRSHPGQGHWEAGKIKTDPLTGQIRMNDYGRPKLNNDKSKVDYDY